VQSAAWRGAGAFAEAGPFEGLRAAAALYPEPLTLVVGADSGVASLPDLLGKRVSLGSPGSGQRGLIAALMNRLGWRDSAFAEVLELEPGAAVAALCGGRIDAFCFAVGHPALAVREATAGCGAGIAPVTGSAVDALVAANPFYAAAEIPGGVYAGVDAPVPTFGVGATLVTRDNVAEGDVATVIGAILDNLGPLAGFDATLAALDPAAMPRRGLTAPLHPGATAAYAARDLIE
jgi:TRAP transporter TAXI family solute receptor